MGAFALEYTGLKSAFHVSDTCREDKRVAEYRDNRQKHQPGDVNGLTGLRGAKKNRRSVVAYPSTLDIATWSAIAS